MKAKKIQYPENLFESLTEEKLKLPNPWQTIYYEGIRGNHLIFSETDQRAFRVDSAKRLVTSEPLDDSVISLVNCKNISDLRLTIDRMPYQKRAALFQLYQRALQQWRDFVKSRLH